MLLSAFWEFQWLHQTVSYLACLFVMYKTLILANASTIFFSKAICKRSNARVFCKKPSCEEVHGCSSNDQPLCKFHRESAEISLCIHQILPYLGLLIPFMVSGFFHVTFGHFYLGLLIPFMLNEFFHVTFGHFQCQGYFY